jgi:hypothetical protein
LLLLLLHGCCKKICTSHAPIQHGIVLRSGGQLGIPLRRLVLEHHLQVMLTATSGHEAGLQVDSLLLLLEQLLLLLLLVQQLLLLLLV